MNSLSAELYVDEEVGHVCQLIKWFWSSDVNTDPVEATSSFKPSSYVKKGFYFFSFFNHNSLHLYLI